MPQGEGRVSASAAQNSAVSLSRLALTNFRNYSTIAFELSPAPVILTGANGSGKTNLLEAVSLLVPGRGMRRARLHEIDRAMPGSANPIPLSWAVNATLRDLNGDLVELATGRDPEAASLGSDRRLVRIDGSPAPQQALAEQIGVVWLTPQMDQVFLEGQGARRKFLDRLVYSFAPNHAAQMAAYETAMRERNQMLQDRVRDESWFAVIERKMAEQAVAIAASRLETAERLNATIATMQQSFPKATMELHGPVEDWLAEGLSGVEVETRFSDLLAATRPEDMYAGRTGHGIHKTELHVFHVAKGMEAAFCSTGEQKAVLLSIVLASARARAKWGAGAPILLLDEVVAHLDVKRRGELADELLDIGVQAWLTGTDAEPFRELAAKAQFFKVSDAIVTLQN